MLHLFVLSLWLDELRVNHRQGAWLWYLSRCNACLRLSWVSVIQWHGQSHHHLHLHHCNSFTNTFHSLETCIIPSEDRKTESLWEVCWALYSGLFGSARLRLCEVHHDVSPELVVVVQCAAAGLLRSGDWGSWMRALLPAGAGAVRRTGLDSGFCGSGLTCAALNRTGPALAPETGVCRGQCRARASTRARDAECMPYRYHQRTGRIVYVQCGRVTWEMQ